MPKVKKDREEKKSKSQMKREMHSLQELGEALLALSPEQQAAVPMPAELREAIAFAATVTKHGARRRQMQLIGKLMRETDPAPIRETLNGFDRERQRNILQAKKAEKWRDEIIHWEDKGKDRTYESLLEKMLHHFPHADRQRLRQLARNARKEKEQEAPPRSSRLLYRYLMELQKE
ncbi:MAG: ribosome biogenesis factor YjgA [Desulfococcaceae bacterium]|nr:ribosome biogenesis factor YjgA [Desulfococcaceae bacterium]